jgi:hypothetical protein
MANAFKEREKRKEERVKRVKETTIKRNYSE